MAHLTVRGRLPLNSSVRQLVNFAFSLGVSVLALAAIIGAHIAGISDISPVAMATFAIVVVSFGAFGAGRGDDVYSQAPVHSPFRLVLAFVIGVASCFVTISLLLAVVLFCPSRGMLFKFLLGFSLIPAPLVLGKYYGPIFRSLSKRWPSIARGTKLD